MRELTILYDAHCAFCVRCRDWLAAQDSFVPLRFVPCASEEAWSRYAQIPWLGNELVAVSDDGDVWIGPPAFLVALWALVKWREWSYRLSAPALAPFAERFLHLVSSNRASIASLLGPVRCEDGACGVPATHRTNAAYR